MHEFTHQQGGTVVWQSQMSEFGESLDNQLTLQVDPNTKLQFKAFNTVLTVEDA